MLKYKVLLLDADGVLVTPPESFSEVYCKKYAVDAKKQQRFYASAAFKQTLLGQLDLEAAIKTHNDLWQWQGEFQDLITMWLEAENYPNEELVDIVNRLRSRGVRVYLATQQEKYRAKYLSDVMFKEILDGAYYSCEIKATKYEEKFWQLVLQSLHVKHPQVQPKEIIYFDDRQSIVDVAKKSGIEARLYTRIDDVKLPFGL